jgi:Protein of unknown function (DUF2971)
VVAHIPPSHLYRYRSESTPYFFDELSKAVFDRELYLVRQSELNDPFEARPYIKNNSIKEVREYLRKFEKVFGKGISITGTNMKEIARELNVPRRTELAMYGTSIESARTNLDLINKSADRIRGASKIACFSERWDSPLMWAHYANSHKGICFEYCPKIEIAAKEKCAPLAVEYTIVRPSITTVDVMEHVAESNNENLNGFFDIDRVNRTFNALAMTKSFDWQYELEWRVTHINDNPSGYVRIAALEPRSIILGANVSEETRDQVIEKFAGKIVIEKAELDKEKFALKRHTLENI